MQANLDTIRDLFSDLKLQDANSKLNSIFSSLSEPKNVGILAASVASSYALYKIVTYSFGQKRFPDFPSVSWFSDHRPILNDSKSGGEFIRRINKHGYPVGYMRFFFHRILVVCDLQYVKELFLTHGIPSSGRVTGHRLHMDDIYLQGVLFRHLFCFPQFNETPENTHFSSNDFFEFHFILEFTKQSNFSQNDCQIF